MDRVFGNGLLGCLCYRCAIVQVSLSYREAMVFCCYWVCAGIGAMMGLMGWWGYGF